MYVMSENIIRSWLERRTIIPEVQDRFRVCEGTHPMLGPSIVIPIHDMDGVFSFNKYRRHPLSTAEPKYLYDKGGKLTLFGAYEARGASTILWTEGEMDALVGWSHNQPSVSGTGGALSISHEWSSFFADKSVIICFDADRTGAEGMVRALKVAPHAKILLLPDKANLKDLSDYMSSGGDFAKLIATAKYFPDRASVEADMSDRLATFRSTLFHEAYLKNHTVSKSPAKLRTQTDDLSRAKTYPITELITFDNRNKAACIWHHEKTASLHYYERTNTVYCFGCGCHGDPIDVYRQINNCSFKDAIKALQ